MLKSKLHWLKLWRTTAWHRGHEIGYKLASKQSEETAAFNKRTQDYYYRHINQCQQTKHVCLKESV